ncbi:proclotting enzyme [Nephila pilipes]|uniref:Proclotting enzyme n=1 Tax=Nephila pilipes TaxID=299642 RepID=A0A8X6PVK8_NEPPI|nr:proclotting enzyme [Nephila pilipes]
MMRGWGVKTCPLGGFSRKIGPYFNLISKTIFFGLDNENGVTFFLTTADEKEGPFEMKFTILLILFHLKDFTSGASLRNTELFNETINATETELNEDSENNSNTHTWDETSHESADLESFASRITPIGRKRPLYTSKTFFGSSQFDGIPRKLWKNGKNKEWTPLQTDRVRNLKSYFDLPKSSLRSNAKNENYHEKNAMYSKLSDDQSKYTNFKVDQIKYPNVMQKHNSRIDVSKHLNNSSIKSGNKISKSNSKDYWHNLDQLHGTETEVYGEHLLNTNKMDQEQQSYNADYSDDVKDNSDYLFKSLGTDFKEFWDDLSNSEGHSSNLSSTAETYSKEHLDYSSHVIEMDPKELSDLSNVDKTDLKEHFNDSSDSERLTSKDLNDFVEVESEKLPSESFEFYRENQKEHSDWKNFSDSKFLERPLLHTIPKTDIASELEENDDLSNSKKISNDVLSEDRKSGRIIDLFPRSNGTRECITPKGENGSCLSLTSCPLIETLNNYNTFLQYMCLTRGIFVGVCCPHNPVIEIIDSTENVTQNTVEEFKQPEEGCGHSANTRIVGGIMSSPHEWTWMVALLRRNRFFCGGVIINDWYILTAAHCVLGVRVKDLKVRLGEYNFNEKHSHQQDIPVAEIKRHALFITLTFQHDIALLKLRRQVEYTKFIGSICLPNPGRGSFSDINATVVGWGTVSFGGKASAVLRQVTIPVWDNDDCDKVYSFERINESFLCAGSPENGEDACQGDSGGPLMALNNEGRWEVIGIVSWGRRCGDPTYPGVYTRVTSYLDWIAENVR